MTATRPISVVMNGGALAAVCFAALVFPTEAASLPSAAAKQRAEGRSKVEMCVVRAAAHHKVDPNVLRAIALAESNLNPDAINKGHIARTGTVDIGALQINTSWLKRLSAYGIKEEDLKDPCVNAYVGAWILKDSIRQHGSTWMAVGAYNTACSTLKGAACIDSRQNYVNRVYEALHGLPRNSLGVKKAAPRTTSSSVASLKNALSPPVTKQHGDDQLSIDPIEAWLAAVTIQ